MDRPRHVALPTAIKGLNTMRNQHLTGIVAALLMAPLAHADPIVTMYFDGTADDPLGGYAMTSFAPPPRSEMPVTSVASPIEGELLFMRQGGTTPLGMTVRDPSWWEWDHGNVYTTTVDWVELIMPVNTRAFSFFVGASFNGRGWIEAIDSAGGSTYQSFNLSSGTTPGFGVYTADSCQAITRIIVEPRDWGVGNFAINQDPCVQVSEPAPAGLLAIGLFALLLSRRLRPATA